MDKDFLYVDQLVKFFPIRVGLFQRIRGQVQAVNGVSFSIARGEIFGLVGESGSGKSTVGKVIVGLYQPTSGRVTLNGRDIYSLPPKELHRQIQMVFQDPQSSLNPRRSVLSILQDPLVIHGIAKSRTARVRAVAKLLESVEISPRYMYKYPSMLSGGQRQRVALARALAVNPAMLVLDEPTSALDVSVQAKIIELLLELKRDRNLTYLFITHDLSLIRTISDRTAVMYLGHICELAKTEDLFLKSVHPYTRTLISATPVVSTDEEKIKPPNMSKPDSEIPSPVNPPPGCPFHPRCLAAIERCAKEFPPMVEIRKGHLVHCYKCQELEMRETSQKSIVLDKGGGVAFNDNYNNRNTC